MPIFRITFTGSIDVQGDTKEHAFERLKNKFEKDPPFAPLINYVYDYSFSELDPNTTWCWNL